ncbi:unnamed protein product [marine sediment metagenome]|uniref:Uncharacterized protein n=1 Tax=marine sediment metagenome TaxID=412755 RepID=X0X6V4_9ZZZZ
MINFKNLKGLGLYSPGSVRQLPAFKLSAENVGLDVDIELYDILDEVDLERYVQKITLSNGVEYYASVDSDIIDGDIDRMIAYLTITCSDEIKPMSEDDAETLIAKVNNLNDRLGKYMSRLQNKINRIPKRKAG